MGSPSVNRGRFRDLTMVLPGREGSGEEGRLRRSDPQIQQTHWLHVGSKITSWRTRKMKLSIKGRQRGERTGRPCRSHFLSHPSTL